MLHSMGGGRRAAGCSSHGGKGAAMTSDRAQVVRVKIEEGKAGLFYATSADLKRMFVAEPTIDTR